MMQPDVLQHLLELPKENLEKLLRMSANQQGPHPLESAAPGTGASTVAHLLGLMSLMKAVPSLWGWGYIGLSACTCSLWVPKARHGKPLTGP